MRAASPYVGLGMQFALTMAFFVGGGYLLDEWLETTPWLVVVGAVLGMVAVFVHLFRVVRAMDQKSRAEKEKNQPGGPPPSAS